MHMQYVGIILISVGSIAALFLLTKLMGKKQLSELSLFDYIIGISIGSIAAELATELENPLKPLIAMVVYALVALLISWASQKSYKLRRFFAGKPRLLLDNDKLYYENFREGRIDLNDFLSMARVKGFYRVSDIATAMLEINGSISFLPKAAARPLTPQDMKLAPEQEHIEISLIADGQLLPENLRLAGLDEEELQALLKEQGYTSYRTIFLCVTDEKGSISVFER